MITHNTDYLGEARTRLTAQFKNKPRIDALLQSWQGEVQAIEDAMWDVFVDRLLQSLDPSGPVDDLLDKLGNIVGITRGGLDNTTFLAFIQARILSNRSDGRRETLLAIASILQPGLFVVREYVGAVEIDSLDAYVISPDLIARLFLIPAVIAGVRLYYIYSGFAAVDTFTFEDSGGSFTLPDTEGFGDSVAGGVGGYFAGVAAGP